MFSPSMIPEFQNPSLIKYQFLVLHKSPNPPPAPKQNSGHMNTPIRIKNFWSSIVPRQQPPTPKNNTNLDFLYCKVQNYFSPYITTHAISTPPPKNPLVYFFLGDNIYLESPIYFNFPLTSRSTGSIKNTLF